MTISLTDNNPRISYTVNAGATQTSFTVPFEFFDIADLNVYVDGTQKSATTHYTVSSGGSGSTGTIALTVTGASGGSTVVITRDIDLARTTDFPTSGSFNIAALNTELDKITAQFADLKDDVDRSLRLQDSDAAASMELPLKDVRKGTVLGFNATTGVPEAGPTIADVSSLSAVTADIATLADIEDGTDATDAIQTVAGIANNVTTVAGISGNVTSVAGNATNINAVVSNASNINTVAGKESEITSVAAKASLLTSDFVSDLNTLAVTDVINDINTLATSDIVSDLNTLATSDIVSDLNTLATSDIVSDINTLATSDIVTDLNLLATSDFVSDLNTIATTTNVNNLATVAGAVSNVNTVAGISSDVTTVAGISSDVAAVENIAANVTSVAGNASNINAAVSNASNINAVVSNASNINSVAGIAANVTTVAGIASNVTTVAGASSNVSTVAGAITNVNNVGGSIANVNTVATNISGVNSFAERYRVGSNDPSSSLDAGDLAYNTSDNALKYYTGSAWASITAGIGNIVEDTTPQLGGDLQSNGNDINFGDNDKASFSSGKLQMYHDGTNAYIDETYANGTFLIRGNNISLQKYTGETMIQCVSDGKVELNFNNVPKLETTSSGVNITGGLNTTSNVDINTTSGNERLNVHGAIGSSAASAAFGGGVERALMDFTGSVVRFGHVNGASGSAKPVTFLVAGGEKARLDQSGNLLIGTTSSSIYSTTTTGINLNPNGATSFNRASGQAAMFNRTSSDGDIVQFRKNGAEVGAISCFSNELAFISGNTGLYFDDANNRIFPLNGSGNVRDNITDLGASNARFKDGYFNGSVYTTYVKGNGGHTGQVHFTGSHDVRFVTNGSEKARFISNSTPHFLVGCASEPSSSVAGTAISTTAAGSFQSFAGTTNTSTHAVFGNTNGVQGTIRTTASATQYNTSSDRRLKSNIEDAASASDKIDAIQVRQFDWNADDSHQDYGLIAQELQPIEPLAVTGDADSDEMMGVDYSKLVPMLIKEIQELRGRVAALEAN